MLAGLRDNAVVMASHAIFPRDGGMEAAASVVGLQFQHSALFSRFMSITSKTMVNKSCLYPFPVLICSEFSGNYGRHKKSITDADVIVSSFFITLITFKCLKKT